MFERNSKKTSGLDSTAVRAAQPGSQTNPLLDPQMPIVSTADDRLVLDVEGLVANQDGTCVSFFIMSNFYTVLRSSSMIAFGSVTNMAHTSIGFRRLDNSFKLSNPSMLFYLRILLGRWILPRNPTQRLDVPRTKVTFFLYPYSLEIQYLHHEKDSKVSQSTRVPKPCTRCFNRLRSKTVGATRASPGSLRMTCRTPLSCPPWLENGSFHSH
jgi:hypothetical protein